MLRLSRLGGGKTGSRRKRVTSQGGVSRQCDEGEVPQRGFEVDED